ncbi:hypothetical protein FHG87_024715 [Trinorchestia longiramus]|nr:hypothetical protein FHG87_024715 [Trinorchestia longiramus]
MRFYSGYPNGRSQAANSFVALQVFLAEPEMSAAEVRLSDTVLSEQLFAFCGSSSSSGYFSTTTTATTTTTTATTTTTTTTTTATTATTTTTTTTTTATTTTTSLLYIGARVELCCLPCQPLCETWRVCPSGGCHVCRVVRHVSPHVRHGVCVHHEAVMSAVSALM